MIRHWADNFEVTVEENGEVSFVAPGEESLDFSNPDEFLEYLALRFRKLKADIKPATRPTTPASPQPKPMTNMVPFRKQGS
jgi:hypothetical protein